MLLLPVPQGFVTLYEPTHGTRAGLGFVLKTVSNNVWIKPTVTKPHLRKRPEARCQHVHSRRDRETKTQICISMRRCLYINLVTYILHMEMCVCVLRSLAFVDHTPA